MFSRFTKDIEEMTGYRPGIYWQFTWRFLAPIIMVCILLSSIASMFIKKPTYSAWDASRVRKTFWIFKFSLLPLPNFLISLDHDISFCTFQGIAVPTAYPGWVLAIAVVIIFAGIAPIPIVFLLRRFQCVKLDVDIHQGSIRRIDTTVSTKEMMGDVDVSRSRKSFLPWRARFTNIRPTFLSSSIILSIRSYTSRHTHLHLCISFIYTL